jgi:hypothetical protein
MVVRVGFELHLAAISIPKAALDIVLIGQT